MARPIFVIAGVGPLTSTSIAKRFAQDYDIALLSRKIESGTEAKRVVEAAGAKAYQYSVDATKSDQVAKAIEEIAQKGQIYGGVYNVGGTFYRKPFLELTESQFKQSVDGNILGAFNFSQQILPHLVKAKGKHPPTLIFTGATASVKSNIGTASFATGKFGLRALSLSLAKEFGPKGVHVSHSIIDGQIGPEDGTDDSKINAGSIAETYWNLHTQHRSGFTWEVDIRPYVEKF